MVMSGSNLKYDKYGQFSCIPGSWFPQESPYDHPASAASPELPGVLRELFHWSISFILQSLLRGANEEISLKKKPCPREIEN